MTREEFYEWLDNCPANWDKDGNRTANPTLEVIDDGFESTTIRFFYDEAIYTNHVLRKEIDKATEGGE